MPKTLEGKEKILDAAAKLFYKNGYKATGVEAIAIASDVTKATLYHHFSNKDELINEALTYLSHLHRSSYQEAWNRKGLKPVERLTVLFDEMTDSFKDNDCYGCPFINAAGEYTERDSQVRKICEAHYSFLTDHLEQFARDAKLTKPRLVAEQIANLIAGSYTGWFVGNVASAAKQGKQMAEMVIAAHQKNDKT